MKITLDVNRGVALFRELLNDAKGEIKGYLRDLGWGLLLASPSLIVIAGLLYALGGGQ